MKKILLFCCAVLVSTLGFSQHPSFSQGDIGVNLGIGFGTTLYTGFGYKATLPPVSASVEFGIKDDFITDDMTLGVGGYVGIAGSKWETSGWGGATYGYKYSYTVIGVRGILHYPLVDNLDTYGGLMLGYNAVSAKQTGDWGGITGFNAAAGGMTYAFFIGGRYFFSDNFGLMAELGYGVAYLNVGVALKF